MRFDERCAGTVFLDKREQRCEEKQSMSRKSEKRKPQGRANEPQDLVVVYRSMGPLRAHVIKGKLESAGIPAVLKYESAGPVFGILVDGMGEVQVLVSKNREQEALEILKTG